MMPRIMGVRADPDDHIWVGVSGADADLERMDIYDRRGRLVARVSDPPCMPAVFLGSGIAALLESDQYDAQRIRIMRVAGARNNRGPHPLRRPR